MPSKVGIGNINFRSVVATVRNYNGKVISFLPQNTVLRAANIVKERKERRTATNTLEGTHREGLEIERKGRVTEVVES